ncbi:MAG TPA: hydantoinase/oxoprolinase family protein [Nevskia sp.]|nr:hydantoinase/oxoprolinase family protein [Nevskia sp.]
MAEAPARTAAAVNASASPAAAGKLINIDNGGTLTDICVIDGERVYRTKTVTTPYDLSKCLFDGLVKASKLIYGQEDPLALLLSTEYIRYSTTQGTNALVERKGPRLGLILGGGLGMKDLQADAQQRGLFASLVGSRVETLDPALDGEAFEAAAVRAVTTLSSGGANRVVVAYGGTARDDGEAKLKKLLLRKFPPQLLGALPILYSHEIVDDANDVRRAWTALFNAFLHPAMERFLYNAEHKLREYRARNPLLIFRNDGHSARVARTIAIKTYSSGPRGGAEGAKALAAHYGFKRLLSMDVGGTTTDIGLVEDGVVRAHARGKVEGVETSFPLCDVVSAGVGGSSIIKVEGKAIKVGPESVGGAPGPACFGLGGKEATMTDAFLLMGLLDPASYFGGELKIDVQRARAAIGEKVARPLGLSEEGAAQAMEDAWVGKIAASLKGYAPVTPDTVLAAFGGAGPFVVCKVADAIGVKKVIIPGLAAVFSAFGIGFSDIAHRFEAPLRSNDAAGLEACRRELLERARRAMFGEGAELDECDIEESLQVVDAGGERSLPLNNGKGEVPAQGRVTLALQAVKPISHASLSGGFGKNSKAAVSKGRRATLAGDLPLYRVEEQPAGAGAAGPAVLEEAFFTCRIESGWRFEINEAGDILLSRG